MWDKTAVFISGQNRLFWEWDETEDTVNGKKSAILWVRRIPLTLWTLQSRCLLEWEKNHRLIIIKTANLVSAKSKPNKNKQFFSLYRVLTASELNLERMQSTRTLLNKWFPCALYGTWWNRFWRGYSKNPPAWKEQRALKWPNLGRINFKERHERWPKMSRPNQIATIRFKEYFETITCEPLLEIGGSKSLTDWLGWDWKPIGNF